MSTGVSQLVLFIVPLLDVDKDSKIMLTRRNSDTCAGELCTNLVKPSGRNASFWTVYIESGHWWVVRCLLGQVAYLDHFPIAINIRS